MNYKLKYNVKYNSNDYEKIIIPFYTRSFSQLPKERT